MKYFSGPEEEPSLHIDIDDFFKALEAQGENLSVHDSRVDKDVLHWSILLKTKYRLDGSVWTKQPMMIMMDGQGDDELAFTAWLRSYIPRERILFVWAEDGCDLGQITAQATIEDINDVLSEKCIKL